MSSELKEGAQQTLSHKELLAILEKQGFKIHESEKEDFPATIQRDGFEKLSPTGNKVLEDLVSRSKNYINGVIIEDTFGDTFEQRQARDNAWSSLEKRHGNAITNIQLRDKLKIGSSVGTIKAYFEWFVKELDTSGVSTERSKSVRQLYKELVETIPHTISEQSGQMVVDTYGAMNFEEKKEVAKNIDDILRRFLLLVTADNTEPKVDAVE